MSRFFFHIKTFKVLCPTAIRLLFLLLLFIPVFTANAQGFFQLDLTVKLRQKKFKESRNFEEKELVGAYVYSFVNKESAATLRAAMERNPAKEDWLKWKGNGLLSSDKTSSSTTSAGQAILDNVQIGGCILVDFRNASYFDGIRIVTVPNGLNIISREDGKMIAELVIESKDDATQMGPVDIKSKERPRVINNTIARKTKTGITINVERIVDSVYARSNARYGFLPKLVLPYENNREVHYDSGVVPGVLDGKVYHRELIKRMGYDISHDKLHKYNHTTDSLYMKDRADTKLGYAIVIDPFDFSKPQLGICYEWYEDFNNVYHESSDVFWAGRWTEYEAFLNWEDANIGFVVDEDGRYAMKEKKNRLPNRDVFHLQFVKNSTELNFSDSITAKEYMRLNQLFSKFDGDVAISPISLKAYSSPEGRESTNRDLAKRRAASLKNMLANRWPSFAGVNIQWDIVPWQEVADTLERRGEKGDTRAKDIAREIREIVANSRTLDEQFYKIKGQSWYASYVEPEVLPAMRRCEFQYETIVFKVLTSSEIVEKYEKRDNDDFSRYYGYEYHNLMHYLAEKKRWKELELVAMAARDASECKETVQKHELDTSRYHTFDINEARKYVLYNEKSEHFRDSLREEARKKNISNIEEMGWKIAIQTQTKYKGEYQRPYALASYYLALSQLRQGIANEGILSEDYFDFGNGGYEHLYRDENQREWGWWNDKAFVTLQSMILCRKGEVDRALNFLGWHININESDPNYQRFISFFKFYGDGCKDPSIVEMIADTSPMNAVVAYVAQEEESYYRKALRVLNGDEQEYRTAWDDAEIDTSDVRLKYLGVLCNYKLKIPKGQQHDSGELHTATVAYCSESNGDQTENLAGPLFEVFRRSPDLYEFFKRDGAFNLPFHVLVDYFWKRIQDGAPMPQIAEEYTQLRNEYSKK